MKLSHVGSLLIFATTVSLSQSSGIFSINFTLSTETAKEGESLTAVCDVTSEGKQTFFIIWGKQLDKDDQLIEIGTNNHVNEHFKNTGRYTATYLIEKPENYSQVRFTLKISDLRSEDSGLLACKTGGKEAEVFKPLTVQVPVHKIWWTSSNNVDIHADGHTVTLKEGDIQNFACHVNGSYPEPIVQVFLGDQDITHLFNVTSSLKKAEGPKGLQPLYYRTDVYSQSTIIGYQNMTKALKCVAKLPNSDSFKETTLNVNLTEYSPKFLCKKKVQVKLHEQFFDLRCKVHASPGVKGGKFHWISRDNNSDTLDVGEKSSDFSANITDGESKDEVIMVLTIYRVSTKHFQQKYVFEAENDIRREQHIIQLEEVSDTTPTYNQHSGASLCFVMKMSMLLRLLLLLMPGALFLM